jgi:nitrite transporter NirC
MFLETVEKFGETAAVKAGFLKRSPIKYFTSSMLAGIFVGLGIFLIFTIGGAFAAAESPALKLLMGVSFGIALTLVIIAGAELFTGNHMVMTIGLFTRNVNIWESLGVWGLSFIGNIAGSLLLALMVAQTGLLQNPQTSEFVMKVSSAKMNAPFWELLMRGVLCNMLVCLAVWMSARVKEDTAKIFVIFWCLFAFITSGFEHSVANMSLLGMPLFMPHPETVSWEGYIRNVLIVSLGNFIGGGLFIGAAYYFISSQKNKTVREASNE